MGTKNNPGVYDCYDKAHPDEPMFILLGRDPAAGLLVRLWSDLREQTHPGDGKIAEARSCARDMDDWCRRAAQREPIESLMEVLPISATTLAAFLPTTSLIYELRRREIPVKELL